MPLGNAEQKEPLFEGIYGIPKLKKTWWSLKPVEHNFNVICFNGDNGAHIVKQLNPAKQHLVRIINCFDKQGHVVFAELLTRFIRGDVILWDDTDNRISQLNDPINPEHSYFVLDSKKLTPNDIVVVDSHTALVYSILWTYFLENGIKIEDGDRADRDAYNYQMNIITWMLTNLKSFPSHVILVMHEMVNELTEPGKDAKGKPARIATGEVITQPTSSSRNHGWGMGKFFSDFIHFELAGQNIYLSTIPKEKEQAGSRTFQKRDTWENMQFVDFAVANGFNPPTEPQECLACVYYGPGQLAKHPAFLASKPTVQVAGKIIAGNPPVISTPSANQSQSESKPIGITIKGRN